MYDSSPKYNSRPLDLDFILLAQDKSLDLGQKMGALGGLGKLDLVQLVTWYLADADPHAILNPWNSSMWSATAGP